MQFLETSDEWKALIAKAADTCLKPWRHSVICDNQSIDNEPTNVSLVDLISIDNLDLTIYIYCRDIDGTRNIKGDIELEIFRSGKDVNLTLCWLNRPSYPMIWQGEHPVWMNSETGKKCIPPTDGQALEGLARRLRALFDLGS